MKKLIGLLLLITTQVQAQQYIQSGGSTGLYYKTNDQNGYHNGRLYDFNPPTGGRAVHFVENPNRDLSKRDQKIIQNMDAQVVYEIDGSITLLNPTFINKRGMHIRIAESPKVNFSYDFGVRVCKFLGLKGGRNSWMNNAEYAEIPLDQLKEDLYTFSGNFGNPAPIWLIPVPEEKTEDVFFPSISSSPKILQPEMKRKSSVKIFTKFFCKGILH